jgi:hypothetical protein
MAFGRKQNKFSADCFAPLAMTCFRFTTSEETPHGPRLREGRLTTNEVAVSNFTLYTFPELLLRTNKANFRTDRKGAGRQGGPCRRWEPSCETKRAPSKAGAIQQA